ncbi:hypothetical protein ACTXT7_008686 [Hymenolepis weldensis]
MEAPFVMRLMASSVSIANFAGSIIRKVLSSGELGIVDKGINDLQTQADRSVQHCIVSSLSKQFPEICIIGEEELGDTEQPHSRIVEELDCSVLFKPCPENLKTVGPKDVVVWVDPLDGTSEFAANSAPRYVDLVLTKFYYPFISVAYRYKIATGVLILCHHYYLGNPLKKVSKSTRIICILSLVKIDAYYLISARAAMGVLEHVTILIGVAVRGRAVGGVVCQPFYMPDFRIALESEEGQGRRPLVQETTQRLIWGLEGLGVFGLSGEPISQAPVFNEAGVESEDKDANRIVCTRSRTTAVTSEVINACLPSKFFRELYRDDQQPLNLYRLGGCGYKMLMLLEGVAHAYIYASPGCKRWDTCAVEALINAIGGKVTGIDGREYSYAAGVQPTDFRGLIVIPNTAWHEEYVKRMPPAIVKSLVAAAPPNE